MSLISGDPLACFNRMDGAGTMSVVPVSDMPFNTAIRVRTGAVAASANPWDIRPRCFGTLPARANDVVAVTFWMRTISAPAQDGFTSFVVEQTPSPYLKSLTYTVAARSEWKKFQVPFTMAQTYAAGGYNLSLWVTYPNQEIEIGGFSILDYGPDVPYSSLGLTNWPYDGHAPDAPWRTEATARIERYRKGDIVVVARDQQGRPLSNARVHLRMKRHAFGFGTAIAGDALQRPGTDGDNYRSAVLSLFNKVVTENGLKWPFFESWGRAQDDFMLPWFAGKGIGMVRGHNVLWPGMSNLPADVQSMLQAKPVDTGALRKRVNDHISQVMAYARGKVTEWDVLNEPYTNKDLQAALGDAEMASWFRQAREADPSAKLYINDYNILEAGGYDLQHINAYRAVISDILARGGPIDGIGLQSHFNSNLTPPARVLELLDQFAAFGKDLQVTEFDVNVADEQLQADYTRDFLTVCFSHPAINGFLIWGFWEGAHWLPRGAMIRKDWSTKPNYTVWNDLIYKTWWTDVEGITAADGAFRTRGYLGDYDVDITTGGVTKTVPLTVTSNSGVAYTSNAPAAAPVVSSSAIVNAASFQGGPVAPGEIVAIFGTNLGPATPASASYSAAGSLPVSLGDTRVLFDGVAAPMIYSSASQVTAIAPYSVRSGANVQVEYLGVASAAQAISVATAAPGIFLCGNKPDVAVVVNVSAGNSISCTENYVAPGPGDIITFFVTGEGAVSPAAGDGQLPSAPFPGPAGTWKVLFGATEAPRCAASFAGLVYAGVTQVNACVPDGLSGAPSVPLRFQVGAAISPASTTLPLKSSWKLIWSDEFNGAAGAPPDPSKWGYDLGDNGWGNEELENYTDRPANVSQDGGGNLVIRALKTGEDTYTSARIKTQGKFEVRYGRVEARIRIPYGKGIWPAFWMLGNDFNTIGWPECGEIDIMESISQDGWVRGTLHGPGYSASDSIGATLNPPAGTRFSDDFHVYGVEWSETSIAFFVDGAKYFEVTSDKIPAGTKWVYQHPFFLILNVAVGGNWPGYPDATTTFPQNMLVDWVRVWQKN